ncbi:MAG: hypothetical protein AAF961_11805, partial [Planctomycetota bacterium]
MSSISSISYGTQRSVGRSLRPRSGSLDGPACRQASLRSLISIGAVLLASVDASADSSMDAEEHAAFLVQAALEAELGGDDARRTVLLAEAQRVSPESAAARWQSGQVLRNGEWKSIEEVSETVSQSSDFQEYELLRAELGDDLAAHLELAEWCKIRGLGDEEQYHWRNVLAALPGHRRARGRLGVREYRGGLFTKEEIEEFKASEEKANDAFDYYEPNLKLMRRAAETRDEYAQQQALEEIAAIDDPAALPALCRVMTLDEADRKKLTRKLGEEGVETFAEALEAALVTAVGNMPQHQATMTLLNYAVFADRPASRAKAIEALKSRPKTDFVPQLISCLTAPIEADIRVYATASGAVKVRQELFQAGPEVDRRRTQSDTFATVVARERGDAPSLHKQGVLTNYNRAESVAIATRAQVEWANARSAYANDRIQEVLVATTGMDHGDDVEAWWDAWETYNEVYSEESPVYEQNYANRKCNYIPAPRVRRPNAS